MNILYINHYAGSPKYGMEFRSFYLAKEWKKLGHSVMIIASSFSHLRINQPVTDKLISFEDIEGIDFTWIKTNSYKANGIARALNIFSFVLKLFLNYKRCLRTFKPDVIIASSTYPLDIIPARRIAKVFNAKVVFEIHDLWPLSPIELGGMSEHNPFILIMKVAEKIAYKKSDLIVSILPFTLNYIKELGITPNKYGFIPNGIVKKEWKKIGTEEVNNNAVIKKLNQFKEEGFFIVGYAGGHSLSNALDTFIDAASLIKEQKVMLILIGSGSEKKRLIEKARSLNLNNLVFFNSINKSLIPNALSIFDVVYIGWQKKKIYKYGISPNKIMDYMMAEKPIIHGIDLEENIVSWANCGITVEPENPTVLAEAITEFFYKSTFELKRMGENGKKYVLENHTYEKLSKDFVNLIHETRIKCN